MNRENRMQHKGTVTLETPRLILRPFTVDDAHAAYANWMGDARVTEFLRWSPHQSANESYEILSRWQTAYLKPGFYVWAIVLRDLGEPIGSISAVEIKEESSTVHIGYCIGYPFWHRGITSEAFAAIISYFFEEIGARRIESQHDPLNVNSGRVMQKCGLTYEGTLRQADTSNRGTVDAAMYSILADEYFAKKS